MLPSVVISGCGAVVNEYYGPLLQRRELDGQLRVIGVHDPSPDRMRAVVDRHFPSARPCAVFTDLVGLPADLVIVAAPPATHAAQVIEALEAGRAVLCEKPMALTGAEAERMVVTAERTRRLLAVALVRRWHPSSRIARWIVRSGLFGSVHSVDVFEGGPFRWPVSGPGYFTRSLSGGGVLADLGPHLLDLLHDWLGELELLEMQDDAMGGVEANALVRLRAGNVPVVLRLTRDWERPNEITVQFDQAMLRWRPDDISHVTVTTRDGQALKLTGPEDGDFLDSFGAMLDAVLERMAGCPSPVVEGREALTVVRLIERAYRDRLPMVMPWLEPAHG
ncbi:oxidoreductase-like protein [Rubellimicrobium mesophilum DSM 19309]|uniref:Oxidoreductase-like protein n=1 Tax=Rubellimicrobium mesophilum DSM 19309 TaxID=442562 RepID=A0A017HP58_9RHOB|nr:Gfo/Idh/MocA family oxidoreductase [Rubellimicrobium mesophilum]EYD75953.1 oxidoreductase-like protein [Rubellimicrobium mesophilum DSM 19309]